MKKIVILIGLFLSITFGVSAQKLGFMAGYTGSYALINFPDYTVDWNQSIGSGFHAGGHFEWNLGKKWGVDAQLLYDMRSTRMNIDFASDTTTRFNRTLHYINLPVHFFYDFSLGHDYLLSPFVGASLNVGLSGKDKAWMDIPTEKPVTLMDTGMYGDEGRVYRYEGAAEIGAALKMNEWQIRATYSVDFIDSTDNDYSWTLNIPKGSKKSYYQSSFKLSICYLFNLMPDYNTNSPIKETY